MKMFAHPSVGALDHGGYASFVARRRLGAGR